MKPSEININDCFQRSDQNLTKGKTLFTRENHEDPIFMAFATIR